VREADAEWVSSDLAELDTIGIEEVIGTHTTNGTEVPPAHVLYRAGFVSDLAAATAERELSGDIWRRLEVVIGNEWLDAWRDGFEPVEVGRVLIWPAWQGDPPEPTTVDQIVLSFDPGRAWGTGGHESTKLALRLLQSLPELIDATLLDAGCGSGILSVAAIRLGAAHADGVDTDMSAPEITRNNAVRNFVGEHIIASNTLVVDLAQTHTGAYDVVVANILAPVLIELASDLLRLRKPGAPIVLAGLIDSQIERVVAAYAPLTATRVISDGVWRGLILR
jgi:ribosomal protein L11 methyltransferase